MKLSNNELMEKWGFWLALYTFASIFLLSFAFSLYPPIYEPNSRDILFHCALFALILLPCFIGGMYYLFLGAKLHSSLNLSIGLSALLMILVVGMGLYIPGSFFQNNGIKIYVILIFATCFLLIVRRNNEKLERNELITKWKRWLINYSICIPLIELPFVLLPRLQSKDLFVPFPLVLLFPSIIGGLVYLGIALKLRSVKFGSVGLASLILTCENYILLSIFVFALRFHAIMRM